MFVLGVALAQDKAVVEKDDFTIDVLDENIKSLGRAVNFLVPAEVWDDGEVDAEKRPSDWLDFSLQPVQMTSARAHEKLKILAEAWESYVPT